jgi:hypothetical protein
LLPEVAVVLQEMRKVLALQAYLVQEVLVVQQSQVMVPTVEVVVKEELQVQEVIR